MIVGRRLDLNFVDKEVHDAYASRQVSFWWSFFRGNLCGDVIITPGIL